MTYHYVLEHEGKPHAKYFEEVSQIPRGSFKEQAISDYVVDFAKKRGLYYRRDESNNVLIRKPATPGYEDHDTVLLQGHMDMIQTKIPGSTFDFDNEPLDFVIKDGYLMAKETTCGSDDGVAIAYMLAILDDDELQHPEIECVFTTAEEAGLVGALNFDCSDLHAKKYINMDGNLEGTSLVIASGSIGGEFIRNFGREKAPGNYLMKISIGGFTGGHGSNAIGKELSNAIKASGRILYYINREVPLRLVSLNGGNMTTIANWADITIAIDPSGAEKAEAIAKSVIDDIREEHKESEHNIHIEVSGSDAGELMAMDEESTAAVIKLLMLITSGLISSSLTYTGVPLTSANLEMCTTSESDIVIRYRPRSAYASRLHLFKDELELLGKLCGIEYHAHQMYYGHNVPVGSPLFQVYNEVWKEMTGEEVRGVAAHFGNEIGTFMSKKPGMDMILLVATHFDAHTPRERLDLASFDRCYECLKRILERI